MALDFQGLLSDLVLIFFSIKHVSNIVQVVFFRWQRLLNQRFSCATRSISMLDFVYYFLISKAISYII
jgi:hypothetical protein